MPRRNGHCSFCGAAFADALVDARRWPRTCAGCGNISYKNPLPVALCLLPVDGGLLLIRRGIPPQIGHLAVPGGFVDFEESWQAAAARELFEEAGIRIPAEEISVFDVKSAPAGPVLIFGVVAKPRALADLPPFQPTEEATERLVIHAPEPLAFPLHTEVVTAWFERRR